MLRKHGQLQAPPETRIDWPWRRSACDRCRSQKLKCVRAKEDDTSRPCMRCLRIRHPCFTSSAKPPGRNSRRLPPAPESTTSLVDAGSDAAGSDAARPANSSTGPKATRRRASEDVSLASSQNSPMSMGWAYMQDEDQNEDAGVFDDGGILMLTPFEENQPIGFEFLMDKNPAGFESVASVPLDGHTSPASHSRLCSGPQDLSRLHFIPASPPPGFEFLREPDDGHEGAVGMVGGDQIPMASQTSNPPIQCVPGALLARLLESLSVQLVRLNAEPWDLGVLSVTVSTTDSGEVDVTSAKALTNEAPAFNPLLSILASTGKFLDICKLFTASESNGGADEASLATTATAGSESHSGPKRRFCSMHETDQGRATQGTATRAGRMSVPSSFDFPFCLPGSTQIPSSSSSPKGTKSSPYFPSSLGTPNGQTIITAAQLLTMVTCYLQVVTIYNDIFSHLLFQLALPQPQPSPPTQHPATVGSIRTGTNALTSRQQHSYHTQQPLDTCSAPMVSSLVLAGYSMPLNSDLQMRLLVEVVEHQFEQIEQALGMPSQYCVSTSHRQQQIQQQHEDTRRGGLLAGPEAKTLLEAVMGLSVQIESGRGADADNNAGRDNSVGVVVSLRGNLAKAQRVRRGGG
ncbi:hypothetical protein MAPG_11870 [Magnaporthiopsis poae ATCC 64411]|uniref:Zn(2)-C6 fungal-type domain-containing protein n=1 Tax=Magnaporthiopsis poae (strain ATCC 64411 / 73-15) TaxID=644358 RepID=A0A0C4EGD4_MAGP6|nr:hypothetical protein MAPG_11870 [Magnaporthiopsis poae ATCC 64411]